MISAVVVNHDGEEHLARCLRSLGESGVDSLEVTLVDNASGDHSLELVERDFPDVRVVALERNVGFAAACNRGAAEPAGDALLFLNPDAWLVDDCLQRLQGALDGDSRLGLVAPGLVFPDGRPQFAWAPDRSILGEAIQRLRNRFESRPWNHRQMAWLLQRVLGPGWFTAACVLVRRQAFDEVGGFDDGYFMYFEDVDLCLRLRRAGWKLASVEGASAGHVRGASAAADEVGAEYRRSQLRYYRRHRPRWELELLIWYLGRRYGAAAVSDWLREEVSD